MIPLNKRLLLENKAWAKEQLQDDPEFFKKLSAGQKPKILWIGCSDSRTPANQITNTKPGDIFVHRNIANIVVPNDPNLLSVIQYAVGALEIRTIVVCGHSACGGVKASMNLGDIQPPLSDWLQPLANLAKNNQRKLDECLNEDEKIIHLAKLSVLQQIELLSSIPFIKNQWDQGVDLKIYGWIFKIELGLLEEVAVIEPATKAATAARVFESAP
jgi:carbonic anhydrase